MAVPPIQRSPKAAATGPTRAVRYPWLLDVILGLLIVAALPLAIVAIPNTVSVVANLLPEGIDKVGLMRAHGLALPAMTLTVPLAAVILRRMNVGYVLVVGLAVLALADTAGGYAGSTFVVGVLRVLHGIGAGVVIPATLIAAWDRAPALRALWTAMLAISLLSAQALALWPLDGAENWKITLQPYPLLSGIGLGLAALYLLVWVIRGENPAAAPRAAERNRVLLATVPAAGIAVLAISSASDSWRPVLVILVAVLSVAALLALASIGTFEGLAGRSLAYTMVAVGVVALPTMAQLTYIEMGGLGGPGLRGLWLPFVIAGVLAVGAAVSVMVLAERGALGGLARWLAPGGLLTIVLGLCAVRLLAPASEGFVLVVPFTLLAVGAAVALTAALRQTGPGAALFALALCFPGVLSGYLLGTGLQVFKLHDVQTAQEVVDGFVDALHLWALIGGFLVVAVIVLAGLLGRRSVKASGTADATGTADTSSTTNAFGTADAEASAVSVAGTSVDASAEVEAASVGAVQRSAVAEAVPYQARGSSGVGGSVEADEELAHSRSGASAAGASSGGSSGDAGSASVGSDSAAGAEAESGEPAEDDGSADEQGDAPADLVEALEDEDRPTGEVPRVDVSGAEVAEPAAAATGPIPVVPPPTQSPEDTAEP